MNSLQPTFSEAFAVEEQLEQSLYHVLYKGIDRASGQPVLIHHWPTAAMSSPEGKERLSQEVVLFQQRAHPHILPILKTFTQQRGASLISPYPQYGSLQTRLNQPDFKPLPLKKNLLMLRQIGQALSHAHQYHMLHGALTPGAIFFTENTHAVVTGFRFPSILEAIPNYYPEEEERLPDIWYMAPERFEGVLDERTDQYALGCLAYTLLTGHVPFPDHSQAVIVRKHRGEPPQPLTTYDAHIPAHIEAAVLRTLAKQPAQRHASIQDFLNALENPAAPQAQTRSVPVPVLGNTRKVPALGNTQKQAVPPVPIRGNTPRLTASVPALGNTRKVAALGNTQKQAAPVAVFGNTRKQAGTSLRSFMPQAQGTRKRKWPFMVGLGILILAVALIVITMNAAALIGGQAKTPTPMPSPTRVAVTTHQPTPTATPVPITTAPAPGAPPITTAPAPPPVARSCTVGYQVTNQGSAGIGGVGAFNGFSADVTITNTGSVAFTNWSLVFSYTQGQQMFPSPDSNPVQNGAQVTVTDDGTNPTIPPGRSITITLVGSWNGTSNPAPRAFTLNNITCQ